MWSERRGAWRKTPRKPANALDMAYRARVYYAGLRGRRLEKPGLRRFTGPSAIFENLAEHAKEAALNTRRSLVRMLCGVLTSKQ